MKSVDNIQARQAAGMSRRDLLKIAGAAGLTMTAGGLLTFGASAQAATPKRGGRVRVAGANSSVSDTLDPAKGTNSGDYLRQFLIFSALTELDVALKPQPGLAESWDTQDGKTWTFRLRQGVTFHDGKSLKPQDVVYSLMRHKDPATASKAKTSADAFESVTASGERDVRVVLKSANVELPALLATSHFLIVQDGTTDFSASSGTGPFKLKSFKPGISTIATRSDNFWKPGQPYLDEIELMGVTDKVARTNALISGDLDIALTVSPRDIPRIRGTGRHDVLETKSGLYTDLILRQDVAPTNNPDFVQAIKYLQNRERMRTTVLDGYGTVANDQPVPPWHPYYLADLPQRPYDPDRAAFHIKRANLTGAGGDLVTSPNIEGALDNALLLQQSANSAGLKLNVRRVPYDGYWSNHWMKHPMSYGSIIPRPTLEMLFSQFFRSNAPWNESGWQNAQFDQLLDAARGETHEARRKQMYGDMQTLIHGHCGVVIPVFISFLDGFNMRVKGLAPNPSGMLMGYRYAEHIWVDG